MPGIFTLSRPLADKRSGCSRFVFFVPLLASLTACNGQTEFVEQSRVRERGVQIGTADADSLGKKFGSQKNESPNVHQDEDPSSSNEPTADTLPDESEPAGKGIEERRRVVGPEETLPRVRDDQQNPANKTESPGAINETLPATVQGPVGSNQTPASSVQIPPSPTPPVQVPAPTNPSVPVSSKPRPGELVTVELTQPRAKADILWVVDNSGSMAWAQEQLKNKFQSFAQKLRETRIDFQLGVTSLDVCRVDEVTGYPVTDALCPDASYIPDGIKLSNKIVGPLRGALQADPSTKQTILHDSPSFIQSFQRTALLGTKGSAFEHGLWASKLAIEKALDPKGANKGFIRQNASLSIIILSDEEDDSVQMWCEDGFGRTSLAADGKKDFNLCREGGRSPFLDAFGIAPFALMKTSRGFPVTTHKYTADEFQKWLSDSSVKGERNSRVSAITGLRGATGKIDCQLPSGGPEESGTNYIRAAQLTGGVIENICAGDWSNVLEQIGQNTVELATRINLPSGKVPFEGSLEVLIDGITVAPSQYSYDRLLHAIVFATPPVMGAEVVVSYREVLVD